MKTNKEIITEIIEDLEKTVGLNWPKQGKVNKINLINCWSEYRIEEYTYYNYSSYNSLHRPYKKLFNNIKNKPRTVKWQSYLLLLYGYKYCSNCKELYHINKFGIDNRSTDKLKNICIGCSRINAMNRDRNRSLRTPKWADLDKIKEIYSKCPDGYHVDHIIPLQGKLVSGLHIAENLQYLTVEQNLRKSNKFEV